MNGWGFLFWMDSIAAVLSLPLVLFIGLMRLVGLIRTRTLAAVLAADAVVWAIAAFFWWGRAGG